MMYFSVTCKGCRGSYTEEIPRWYLHAFVPHKCGACGSAKISVQITYPVQPSQPLVLHDLKIYYRD